MTADVGTRRPWRLAPGVVVLALAALTLLGCAPAAPTGVTTPAAGPSPTSTEAGPAPAVGAEQRATPTSLRIPAIDVDEDATLRLGIAPDGSAEVPADYDRVGWFDRGAVPGDRGATVLLGHVDSRTGPAVFYRLRDLRPGDTIDVGRTDGTSARYVVRRTEQVAKDRFPTFAVFGATSDDVVRLVTCAGAFDRGARSYTDNLVVHADRA